MGLYLEDKILGQFKGMTGEGNSRSPAMPHSVFCWGQVLFHDGG